MSARHGSGNVRPIVVGALALFLAAVPVWSAGRTAAAADGLPRQWLYQFGAAQAPAAQLGAPAGIGASDDGSLYVFDADNSRLQRLDSAGRLLSSWGRLGGADGQFMPFAKAHPEAAPDGTVYVSDQAANRIAHFAADGTYLGGWPFGVQTAAGVAQVVDVAAAPDGSVWGLDANGLAIRHFSATGALLGTLGDIDSGAYPGYIPFPSGADKRIAVGRDGSVYVIRCTVQVVRYSAEGAFRGAVAGSGSEREWVDPEWRFMDVDGGLDDTVYLLRRTYASRSASRVDRMAPDGRILGSWPVPIAAGPDGTAIMPTDIAVAADGSVYVSDTGNGRVLHFGADGSALEPLGSPAETDPSRLADIVDLASIGGRVLVLVAYGPLPVRVYSQDGEYVGAWGQRGSAAGQIGTPVAMAAAPDGSLLVLDGAARVQRFSVDGEYLGRLGKPGDVPALAHPTRIVVAGDGTSYLADGSAVFRFGKNGEMLKRIGEIGQIVDIAVAADGTLLVALWNDRRVRRFDARAEPLPAWDSGLTGLDPAVMVVDADGRLLVGDISGRRFVAFRPDGAVAAVFGVRQPVLGTDVVPYRMACGSAGRLLVAQAGVPGLEVLGPALDDSWRADLFGDRWLGGAPLAHMDLPAPEADWGGAPAPGVPPDGFSAAFERNMALAPAVYRFRASATGGVRLWVGGHLAVDASGSPTVDAEVERAVFGPTTYVRLEYSDSSEAPGARSGVKLTWAAARALSVRYLPVARR